MIMVTTEWIAKEKTVLYYGRAKGKMKGEQPDG